MTDNYNNTIKTQLFYDLFLNLPHPAASKACLPYEIVTPNNDFNNVTAADSDLIRELSDERSVARITRFAFPEFNDHGKKIIVYSIFSNMYLIQFLSKRYENDKPRRAIE